MSEVRVSVIIPAYGHASLIGSTLGSVFEQDYRDYEIVVVNDGSPDNTEEVIEPFVRSGRVRYFYQRNAGQSAARNFGLSQARGHYIALLDDDDIWPKDKLTWQVALLEKHPDIVLAYGFCRSFTDNTPDEHTSSEIDTSQYPSGDVFENFLVRNWIVSPGQTLIRRSALDRVGGFDRGLWGTDDYDLYVRLAKVGRFAFESRCSLYYRKHQNNASRDLSRMFHNQKLLRAKHFGFPPPLAMLPVWCRSEAAMRRQYYTLALRAVRDELGLGHRGKARARLLWGARVYPRSIFGRSFWLHLMKIVSANSGPA